MTGDSESFGESRSQSRHDRIIDQRPRKHDFQEPPERCGGLGAGLIICAVGNDPSKESRLRRLREVWISRLKMKRAATRSDCWLSAAFSVRKGLEPCHGGCVCPDGACRQERRAQIVLQQPRCNSAETAQAAEGEWVHQKFWEVDFFTSFFPSV
ncbi:hypothetical protein B0H14DRAFT_2574592 [Mycena olivaceomarginata]|nr:hypothetical protein B0H14DRAFT_2574592 [Mycena olivaceomarginata]